MDVKHSSKIRLIIVVASILHAAFVLLQNQYAMMGIDDSLYYFEVARNFGELGWWTFDGLHTTNGVQPLWNMILSITSLVMFSVDITDKLMMLRVFFLWSVFFNILAGWYGYRLAKHLFSRYVAMTVLVLWLFTPRLVMRQLSGMENALFAFTLMLALWLYINLRNKPNIKWYDLIFLGLSFSLLFLSRVDTVVFLALFGMSLLYRWFRHPQRLLIVGLSFLIPILLYFAYNWLTFGHLLPISGAVKLWESQTIINALGGYTSFHTWRYILIQLASALLFIGATSVDILSFAGLWVLINPYVVSPIISMLLNQIVIFPIIALGVYPNRHKIHWKTLIDTAMPQSKVLLQLIPLSLGTGLYLGVHTILNTRFLTYSGVNWYFVALYWLLILFVSIWLTPLIRMIDTGKHAYYEAIILIVLSISLWVFFQVELIREKPVGHRQAMIMTLSWIEDHIPEDAVLASDNSGSLGYFLDHTVINTDGMINNYELLGYIQDRNLVEYLCLKGVTYYVDFYYFRDITELVYKTETINLRPFSLINAQREFPYYVSRLIQSQCD